MKKLLIASFVVGAFALSGNVQAQNTPLTKEEKAQMKAKKEEDLNNAIKETGLTKEQETQVRDVLKDAEQKGKDVKNNDALSDEEKTAKKDEINSSKNDKLKEIMGAEKFKLWSTIRKKQKEQSTPPPPPAAPAPPPPTDN